MGVAL